MRGGRREIEQGTNVPLVGCRRATRRFVKVMDIMGNTTKSKLPGLVCNFLYLADDRKTTSLSDVPYLVLRSHLTFTALLLMVLMILVLEISRWSELAHEQT